MNLLKIGIGFLYCAFFSIAAYAQDSIITVVAQPGEGAYSLLRKHGLNPAEVWTDFLALNAPKLGEGNQLYSGYSYDLPVLATSKLPDKLVDNGRTTYPIFGKSYAEVPTESNRLKNAVIYLVSGPGGPDPGAVTQYGETQISEDE